MVLAEAESAGARVLKPAEEAFWGSYSGYFPARLISLCRFRDSPDHCKTIDAVVRDTNLAFVQEKRFFSRYSVRQDVALQLSESYRQLLSSLVSVTASLFFFGDIRVCCGHAVM